MHGETIKIKKSLFITTNKKLWNTQTEKDGVATNMYNISAAQCAGALQEPLESEVNPTVL